MRLGHGLPLQLLLLLLSLQLAWLPCAVGAGKSQSPKVKLIVGDDSRECSKSLRDLYWDFCSRKKRSSSGLLIDDPAAAAAAVAAVTAAEEARSASIITETQISRIRRTSVSDMLKIINPIHARLHQEADTRKTVTHADVPSAAADIVIQDDYESSSEARYLPEESHSHIGFGSSFMTHEDLWIHEQVTEFFEELNRNARSAEHAAAYQCCKNLENCKKKPELYKYLC
ncbi:uncharacterized protein LOC106649626 isoform X2 [Trichogramma pretiosum]|uniref:uncharacterized protein LOC106649626 isoform X2 n=1 Tax=Trichogramma pretiosum TaxID=7493 RepID=UPI0006C9B594|nr:uncharacterized protein LOC106649626 isoform X2 [Trichogramma pretiosum]